MMRQKVLRARPLSGGRGSHATGTVLISAWRSGSSSTNSDEFKPVVLTLQHLR